MADMLLYRYAFFFNYPNQRILQFGPASGSLGLGAASLLLRRLTPFPLLVHLSMLLIHKNPHKAGSFDAEK
ncbi:hypothetical protein [Rahnella aceris]|jgi:hypothetical protein|uniref:hypothetical protein n=1 Tax=Rahnella sp. (strain Y9602) TaxID=2703885 RepID=UPI001F1AC145|nr:hypothetical protein FS594_08605 [Rahnella aquatilis]